MNFKLAVTTLFALLATSSSVLHAQGQGKPFHADVWFCATYPEKRKQMFPNEPPSDGNSMFLPNAPWRFVSSRLSVLKLSSAYVLYGNEDDLKNIFAYLKERNIALGVEAGWLFGDKIGPGNPGYGVEGFAHPGSADFMAKRIKRLGGDLKFIVMDEPLYYGHVYAGKNATQMTIPEVARRVAVGVREWRAEFPEVQIGDGEPIGGVDPGWSDRFLKWSKAYQEATGTPLAFFHCDIFWKGPWQQELPKAVGTIRSLQIPFGIIYNGGPADTTEQWTANAIRRFTMIENNPATCPDQVVFQSWEKFPTYTLPENKPGTETFLALQYLRRK